MSAAPTIPPHVSPSPQALSARLTEPLRKVSERQWILRLAQAILQLIAVTLSVWLVVVLTLGGWPAVPVVLRLLLAGIAWGTLVLAARRLLRPAFQRRGLGRAARDVEQAVPEIQERISSAVELLAETDVRFRGSLELIAHLVRQAEVAAQEVDPIAVISSRNVVRWLLLCLPLLAAWAIVAATSPEAVARGLRQTFLPWNTVAALPQTKFELTPGNVDLAQGDPLTIGVQLTQKESVPESERPPLLVMHYPGGQVASQPMNRTGAHAYEWPIDHVLQGFTYQVTSGGDESPLCTVHVLTRPAAKSIDVTYRFPAYTGLPDRTDKQTDGAIDALVGTRVTVTVHANQALNSRSRVIFAPDSPDQLMVDLVPVKLDAAKGTEENVYSADLTFAKPGHYVYRFALASTARSNNADTALELTNDNDTARPVLVRADAPPHITIDSPDTTIKIRPDDTAIVRYSAGDDYGVAQVLARVQVDDHPAQVMALPLSRDRGRDFTGQWALSVPEQLQRQGLRDARRITYQLKAVDNCAPVGQEAVTPVHTLELDANVAGLAGRQDEQSARNLVETLQQARQTLDDAQKQITALQQTPADKPLSAAQQAEAETLRDKLADTTRKLSDAAQQARDGPFARQAKDTQKAAQEPVKTAADDLAKTGLAADQPKAQHDDLQHAGEQIADAQRQLDAVAKQMGQASRASQLARTLEDLSQKQNQAADAQAAAQTKDAAAEAKAREEQRQLQEQLDKAIRENPDLQNAAVRSTQPRSADLQKKLDNLETNQKPLADETNKQAQASDATAHVPDVAKEQEKLNQDITDFNNRQNQALKDAAVKPPDPAQLDSIDKNLDQNKLSTAAQQQRANAAALNQAAEKAALAARHDQELAQQRQLSAAKNQQAVQDAAKADDQARQLAKDTQDAKTQPRSSQAAETAKRETQELAQKIEKQADALAGQDPHQKQAMSDIHKTAEQAKQDIAKGKTEDAQQKLTSAAQSLSQAAQQTARDNDPAAAKTAQDQQTQTAKEASDLAARQSKLAEQTNTAAGAKENAADHKQQAQDNAAQQQQQAKNLDQAANDARQLQHDSQSTAPGVADRAGKAAEALSKAAQAERQAAGESNDPAKAQQAQNEADRQLATARQMMQPSASPTSSGKQSGEPQAGQPGQSGQAGQLGQSPSQNPGQSPGQGSPQNDGTDTAAQAIAEKILQARDAQKRAADGDPNAAREAAQSLAAAAQQIAQSTQRNGAPTASSTAPPTTPSNSAGQPTASGQGSPPPNKPLVSGGDGQGLKSGGAVTEDVRPDAVKEIGLSPSDWAHLPTQAQQQLLNAAQQKGPPAYQEMVKNYYLRVARLQATDAETH